MMYICVHLFSRTMGIHVRSFPEAFVMKFDEVVMKVINPCVLLIVQFQVHAIVQLI